MKSIEEKAKAYDEALKVLHKYDGANIMFSQSLKEEMFPELKESEDERIKDAAIEFVRQNKSFNYRLGISKEEVIAWLEKQGEQKPADKVEPIFNVGDKVQYSKGCGTIMTIEKIENGEYIFADNMGHTTIESGTKWHLVNTVEQNPAWSEEDENKVTLFMQLTEGCDHEEELADWLKSIKDRVQPKQEWSEEDESNRTSALMLLMYPITIWDEVNNNTRIKAVDWLKSLKNKYVPQLKQDWSEEDESRRKKIIHILSLDGRIKNEELSDINNWLKSLRPQSA